MTDKEPFAPNGVDQIRDVARSQLTSRSRRVAEIDETIATLRAERRGLQKEVDELQRMLRPPVKRTRKGAVEIDDA